MPTSATPVSPAHARPGYQSPNTCGDPGPLIDRTTGETKAAEPLEGKRMPAESPRIVTRCMDFRALA
jgi:hypothetical protein